MSECGVVQVGGARAAKKPCEDCPWRTDVAPGQFPAGRYYGPLQNSSGGTQGDELPIGAPMFACHKSAEGKEIVCAGWLAREGWFNLTARLNAMLASKRGEHWHFEPQEGWPELFKDYDVMARTMARWDDDWDDDHEQEAG